MRRNQKYFLFLCLFPMPIFIYHAMQSSEHCCMSSNEESHSDHSSQRKYFNSEDELNLNYIDEQVPSNYSIQGHATKETVITANDVLESTTKMCENNSSLPQRLEDLSKHEKYVLLNHILVNDEYKLMYCYTPKVACSNWKKVMMVLNGDIESVDVVKKMDHTAFKKLNEYSAPEIKQRLRSYYRFMFVRNPTERVMSVYRNKFHEVEAFYKVYGKKIMDLYHPDRQKFEGYTEGDDVSFSDFLRYITHEEPLDMNEHWMPMNLLCQPCVMNYDFIGTVDNIEEDSETVLRAIEAPETLHFPKRQTYYHPTSPSYLAYYFSLISPEALQEFVEKFSLDYEMFSYPKPYFSRTEFVWNGPAL